MESTFTSLTSNVGNADGATSTTATSHDGGCASLPQVDGEFTLPIRSASRSSISTSTSTSTLESTIAVDGSKRKRSLSETPEEERPAKKHYIPSRYVVFNSPSGTSVTIHFQGYIDEDVMKEVGVPDDGIPEDVDANIYDLVGRDPEACYNHPWVDLPGLVEYVLEDGLEEATASIHDDSDESLYALGETYGDIDYYSDSDDYSDEDEESDRSEDLF
ncbi:hypothetical protein F4776DRAFT_279972 [Hypoxylon sp. NC0597]|nr:hypothetical protein F4776DRAFT_279972 [Hypoxylon sp. NC0597]